MTLWKRLCRGGCLVGSVSVPVSVCLCVCHELWVTAGWVGLGGVRGVGGRGLGVGWLGGWLVGWLVGWLGGWVVSDKL